MYSPTVRRALHREPAVHEVPGQVLLDQGQAEEVAQPGQDLPGARVRDLAERLGEGLPLQQFGVRLGGFDEFVLVRG